MSVKRLDKEMKEALKPKIHNTYLRIVFSAVERIVIAFTKIAQDPTKASRKITKEHINDPNMFFDKVIVLDMVTPEYLQNGDPITLDLVEIVNNVAAHMEHIKVQDPSMTYIEMFHNSTRLVTMMDKRNLFNHVHGKLEKCTSGSMADMFKRNNNTVYVRDILEYLDNRVVRASTDPSRYREQLKKAWEQLVTSSTVRIQAEQGERITNGILLQVNDQMHSGIGIRLFVYLETPDIVIDSAVMIDELNHTVLCERHPEMTTLVFESTSDFEFFYLILNGLFNIPIWRCYGEVTHGWTYEEGMPCVGQTMTVFQHDPFKDSGLADKEGTLLWQTIEDKFIQYHLYLIRCIETNQKEVTDYVDYGKVTRNEGFVEKKESVVPVDTSTEEKNVVVLDEIPKVLGEIYTSTTGESLPQTNVCKNEMLFITHPNDAPVGHEGTTVRNPYPEIDFSQYPDGTVFNVSLNSVLVDRNPQEYTSTNIEKLRNLYDTTAAHVKKLEKINRLTHACAELGVTPSFLTELKDVIFTQEQHLDGMIALVELLVKHPTRGDDMLKTLKSLVK